MKSTLGRPRSFSDDEIFNATVRVLARDGVLRLTLAAVAREVGCTGQALSARFGTRADLLAAYSAWATDRSLERFHQVSGQHRSPLAALRARFALPVQDREDELAEAGIQVQMLSLLGEAQRDPVLLERLRERAARFQQALTELIERACDAGELAVPEPWRLAYLLTAATTGGSILSSLNSSPTTLNEVIRIVDDLLAPYIIAQGV